MMHCDDTGAGFLNESLELEELSVISNCISNQSNAILCHRFPCLRSFRFQCYENNYEAYKTFNITQLNTFLSNHIKLEDISLQLLKNCDYSLITDMKQLKKLNLYHNFCGTDAEANFTLANMPNLESLTLRGRGDAFLPQTIQFLNECASADTLEELIVYTFRYSICRCNEIKDDSIN